MQLPQLDLVSFEHVLAFLNPNRVVAVTQASKQTPNTNNSTNDARSCGLDADNRGLNGADLLDALPSNDGLVHAAKAFLVSNVSIHIAKET